MSNLPAIVQASRLQVQQKKDMLEVFTSFETKNCYEISDADGRVALYAGEQGGGAFAFLTRSFLKAKRPFTMQLARPGGGVALTLRRPWNWFFSELHVLDASGQKIGMIDQRFALLSKRFVILGPSGEQLAELHGPMFRPWTFKIMREGREIGKIAKKWSGLLKEAFTDADNFGIELGPEMDPQLRTLALAATFLIDFLYFEDNGKR